MRSLLLLGVVLLGASGCAHYEPLKQGGSIVRPVNGRLFLIRQLLAETSLWCCDANTPTGVPICYDAARLPRDFQRAN